MCSKLDFIWWTWENSPVLDLLAVICMMFWRSSRFNSANVRQFILHSCHNCRIHDTVSKTQSWLWNIICVSFGKIWTEEFSPVRKFYFLKSKVYGHDIWTWEFSLVWNKGEQVIVILYTYLNNVAEFFILHYINMGIFLSLDDLLSKFPFCRFILPCRFCS